MDDAQIEKVYKAKWSIKLKRALRDKLSKIFAKYSFDYVFLVYKILSISNNSKFGKQLIYKIWQLLGWCYKCICVFASWKIYHKIQMWIVCIIFLSVEQCLLFYKRNNIGSHFFLSILTAWWSPNGTWWKQFLMWAFLYKVVYVFLLILEITLYLFCKFPLKDDSKRDLFDAANL